MLIPTQDFPRIHLQCLHPVIVPVAISFIPASSLDIQELGIHKLPNLDEPQSKLK